jgi:hypothetical protein
MTADAKIFAKFGKMLTKQLSRINSQLSLLFPKISISGFISIHGLPWMNITMW